jgi:hypothetical protein
MDQIALEDCQDVVVCACGWRGRACQLLIRPVKQYSHKPRRYRCPKCGALHGWQPCKNLEGGGDALSAD